MTRDTSSMDPETFALLQRVHGRLSEAVRPATPESIEASDIMRNRALLTIAWFGLLFLIMMLAPPILGDVLAGDGEGGGNGVEPWIETTRIVGAAGLGAVFFSLISATKYLRERTFDPKFNQVYLVRFALGILAGIILAEVGQELLGFQSGEDFDIRVSTLALVGGFSAEAVAELLKRFSETLLTLVRGSGTDRARAEAQRDATKFRSDVSSSLSNVMVQVEDPETRERLKQLIKDLNS